MSLENLREKRHKWVEANRENGFEDGIKRLLTDLYPDNAHFIYELLQNAEDTQASVVRFTLSNSAVEFEHDGERLFALKDVESITSIGVSTKRDDSTSIGKFGVGFKAVFAYTNTPEIHSGDFHFRIHDLVVPETDGVPRTKMSERETRFVFPFDNKKKPRNQAVREVELGLRALGDNTLLFLSHIRKIEYLLPDGTLGTLERFENKDGRIEIRASQAGGEETVSHWLRFENDVEVKDEDDKPKTCRIAVAYNLAEEEGKKGDSTWKIVPLDHGEVSIYFPAEKETSNLRFHLHAPFASTVARDSVRDCTANHELRNHVADLVVKSLAAIRDQDMLTVGFLATLPNPQDNLSAFYEPIREAVVAEMNEQPLTPTHGKSHAPAKYLLQAKASLKDLLSTDDIKFLIDYDDEPPQWAARALQGTNSERFMTGLAITDWNAEQFVELLQEDAAEGRRYISSPPHFITGPNDEFMAWLAGKPVEWHQEFYALLYSDYLSSAGWKKEGCIKKLKSLRIIRLSNGNFSVGTKCFFPSDGVEHDDVLPRVDTGIYTSGKSKNQQEQAKKFLEEIGVREVGEAEQVEAILKQRYVSEGLNPKKQDLRRFIALVEREPEKACLFANYFIFKREDGKWGEPSQVFLDQPFMDTGLAVYYDLLKKDEKPVALASSYQACGINVKKLVKFAKAVGVQTQLEIIKTRCNKNPERSHLYSVGGNSTSTSIDCDFEIPGLEEILLQPCLAISKLIWRTMSSLEISPNRLRATYQNNQSRGAHCADSQLVHQLRKAAWVPQSNENFVCPTEASRELLPEGFPFDPGWPWLKAIHLGHEAVKKSEVYRQQQAVVEEWGFESAEEVAKWKKVKDSGADPDEILAQYAQCQRASQPEQSVPDPDRRRKNVLANTADAPSKESVQRERSVQKGISEVAAEAKAYLRAKYRNPEGQLVCQCCKDEMPFKLPRSEEYYFEAVQCIGEKETRHFQNRLALCPTCAAMYQYARETDDTELRRRIVEHDADDKAPSIEIPVHLAGCERTLRFVGTHWFDLKTVLKGS